MKILVLGGTRFFGVHLVTSLLRQGHEITVATRQNADDCFGNQVSRIKVDRTDPIAVKAAFQERKFDVVYDQTAYCSDDVKYALDALHCGNYILMSSTAVYAPKTADTKEADFDGSSGILRRGARADFPYDEGKRQAERALRQMYPDRKHIAVRYPFVIGTDDYTQRLRFYVEHTMHAVPMRIDNLNAQMGFIRSDEAGEFLAFLASADFIGAVNGSAHGTISLNEILRYIEAQTGTEARLSDDGDAAPYNGECDYSISTERAEALGFTFSNLKDWIFDLLDDIIKTVNISERKSLS